MVPRGRLRQFHLDETPHWLHWHDLRADTFKDLRIPFSEILFSCIRTILILTIYFYQIKMNNQLRRRNIYNCPIMHKRIRLWDRGWVRDRCAKKITGKVSSIDKSMPLSIGTSTSPRRYVFWIPSILIMVAMLVILWFKSTLITSKRRDRVKAGSIASRNYTS